MKTFPIQFGIETEIGISRECEGELDVVAESIALVRSAMEPGVSMRWDYAAEDPHADMRGFRVRALRQDTDESDYQDQDERRELSFVEIKSDLVLGNGARLYNDHAHPEYCTPECSTVDELIEQDRAGEQILMNAASALSRERGSTVRLYKNNTDYCGHSYGCHENYLLPRKLPWEILVAGVQAFLVTRQIFAGAGKFALESEDRYVGPGFQISQRSDFFTELQSVDTMQQRPLINTRDEPHADSLRFRRFHVIVGDANMSPFATRLKVGTLALVLEAIGTDPSWKWPLIVEPVETLRTLSRDGSFRWELCDASVGATTAVEVQRRYLDGVRARCDLSVPWKASLVGDWEEILDDLDGNVTRCSDRLDWVAKHELIRRFQREQDLPDTDPWLLSLDLEYHRLDRGEGLYFGLEQSGQFRGVPDGHGVERAVHEPPETTRAFIRGRCVHRFASAVVSAQWDHVTLRTSSGPYRVSFLNLFGADKLAEYRAAVEQAGSPDELRRILEKRKRP